MINSPKAGLLYGPSDTGKTAQIGRMALYVWKKYHKRTRLISADGGGWETLRPLISIGLIEPFSLLGLTAPGEWIKFLFEGHWPHADATGKLVIGTKQSEPNKETFEKYGGLGIEGIYSISTLLMQHYSSNTSLSDMAGGAMTKDNQVSKIQDGKDIWVQPGIGFYNFILQKMGKYAFQSSSLPFEKILWTSLIDKFVEKDKQQNIIESGPYGPAMVGKQGIKVIPQWFGDLIHLDIIHSAIEQDSRPDRDKTIAAAKVGTVTKQVRAYIKSHTHPKDGLLCPAKPRVDPSQYSQVPAYKDFTAEEGFMDWLYELEDTLSEKAEEKLKLDLPDWKEIRGLQ